MVKTTGMPCFFAASTMEAVSTRWKRLMWMISGFSFSISAEIFFFASKENTKNITKEETFVYRAETDSTSLADTSAGIYANGKVQTKKETFYLIYSEGRLCIYRGDDKIFYDYADVAVNLMPVEIREQLKFGLYITGEQELYEFLQTYSS